MPKPKGPDKYTEEYVTEQVEKILDIIKQNEDIVYIGEVFEDLPYSRQRFSEWDNDFDKNDNISDTIKKIREILESRVNVGGLKGDLNSTMAIFNLKNNYDWKDKQDIDMTSKGEKLETGGNVDVDKLTEEYEQKVKEEIKKQLKNESS